MTKDFIFYYFIIICEKMSKNSVIISNCLGFVNGTGFQHKKTKASKAFARQSYLWSQGGSNP
ncbi:hypothetical protein C6371_15995 [Bacillus atrophaeus]|nr:hypothetical protein C6371_15995 [Bacillus atrophaeus]